MTLTLAQLKALAEAATSGPWRSHENHSLHEEGPVVDNIQGEYVCSTATDGTGLGQSDADFIAASRTAIPLLIEEVERLREAIKDSIARSDDYGDSHCSKPIREALAQSKERLP